MEINKIESVRKALLEALEAQQTDNKQSHSDINKSSQDALQDAIDDYLTNPLATPLTPQKTATIKLKGIALTHLQAQGGPANNRPVSLLMKANIDDLTDEQKAALERLGYALGGE
ncbi:TPA: hypothetical protein JAN03_20240 [Citrobacter freundii]|nr:hypothetical protein [Citrobacter freundii]